MSDFVRTQGLGFFSYIYRRLNDRIIKAFEEWAPEAGFKAPPRTHSTLQAVRLHGPIAVTDIADLLGQSHVLIIKWVRQLHSLGLVEAQSDPDDGRRTLIRITRAGQKEAVTQDNAREIIARAYLKAAKEADAEVIDALWRLDAVLRKEPFLQRLRREQARTKAAKRKG